MSLELLAMRFLRFEKACPVALFERTPRYSNGEPDVLGVTKARYLLEIEIKRSVADFRANKNKPFHAARNGNGHIHNRQNAERWPKQFWFLVPPELVTKVERHVPEWAGLMRGPEKNEGWQVWVVKKAPVNKESKRLSNRELMDLGHCMANQIYKLTERLSERYLPYEPWSWYPQI